LDEENTIMKKLYDWLGLFRRIFTSKRYVSNKVNYL
jgi:hypothetical protein